MLPPHKRDEHQRILENIYRKSLKPPIQKESALIKLKKQADV